MSELSRKQILDSRVLADQEYKVIAAKHNEQNRKIIVQFDFFLADSTFDLFSRLSAQLCLDRMIQEENAEISARLANKPIRNPSRTTLDLFASRFSRRFCRLCGASVKTQATFLVLFAC